MVCVQHSVTHLLVLEWLSVYLVLPIGTILS